MKWSLAPSCTLCLSVCLSLPLSLPSITRRGCRWTNVLNLQLQHRSPARPSQGELSAEEVNVLKDSSRVNGKLFLPWIAEDLQVCVCVCVCVSFLFK